MASPPSHVKPHARGVKRHDEKKNKLYQNNIIYRSAWMCCSAHLTTIRPPITRACFLITTNTTSLTRNNRINHKYLPTGAPPEIACDSCLLLLLMLVSFILVLIRVYSIYSYMRGNSHRARSSTIFYFNNAFIKILIFAEFLCKYLYNIIFNYYTIVYTI